MAIFKCRKCEFKCTERCDHFKCGGTVVEADYGINISHEKQELVCINCGKYYEVNTQKYLKLLDMLKIDYKGRIMK
jgi:transcription elongation factor Elf1